MDNQLIFFIIPDKHNVKGMLKYFDGEIYNGFWEKDRRRGRGNYTFTNAGEWRDGRRHGEGKYIYSGGNIYEGNRKRNKQQAIGTYTYVS